MAGRWRYFRVIVCAIGAVVLVVGPIGLAAASTTTFLLVPCTEIGGPFNSSDPLPFVVTVNGPDKAWVGAPFTISFPSTTSVLPNSLGNTLLSVRWWTNLSMSYTVEGGTFIDGTAQANGTATANGVPTVQTAEVLSPTQVRFSIAGPVSSGPLTIPTWSIAISPDAEASQVRVSAQTWTQTPVTTQVGGITFTCTFPGTPTLSTTVSQTEAVPDAPSDVWAIPQDGAAAIAFSAPADDGARAVDTYAVRCTSLDQLLSSSATGSISPIVVGGLTDGTPYTCDVTATNAVGTGNPSTSSAPFTPAVTHAQSISIGNASIVEGDAGGRTLNLPVALSHPATGTVSVKYRAIGVTATRGLTKGSGADFKPSNGALTFYSGQLVKSVPITVFTDTTTETDETLRVTLLSPTGGARLGRTAATGTIVNDDGITTGITAGVGDKAVVKADSHAISLSVPVTLSAPVTTQQSFVASIFDGSYYAALAFPFPANTVTQRLTFKIAADPNPQQDRTITIMLAPRVPSTVTIIKPMGTVTIYGA
jgi:hypothetical protein